MSKKFYLFCAILICILATLLYFIIVKIKAQPNAAQLPNFTFQSLNGQPYTQKKLPEKEHYLVLYFSPDCHYCTDEMNDMIKHKQMVCQLFYFIGIAINCPTTQRLSSIPRQ